MCDQALDVLSINEFSNTVWHSIDVSAINLKEQWA